MMVTSSTDLINWIPVDEEDTAKKSFDSLRNYEAFKKVLESGPQAILTNQGILFIYNSRNDPKNGDTGLPAGTYAAGQALFDKMIR